MGITTSLCHYIGISTGPVIFQLFIELHMSGEQVREWRDVCGDGGIYVGRYQISNDGLVKSTVRVKAGQVLKGSINGCGYRRVVLCVNDNYSTRRVHRLVAEAFLENPDGKDEVDHIDRDKLNNNSANLRWVTHSENQTNRAGYTNTGIKHISRTHNHGNPRFHVSIQRGGKYLVRKYFPIKDRDEADVLAEAVAYRNDVCAELGVQVDD
jgi:hypothetical protein